MGIPPVLEMQDSGWRQHPPADARIPLTMPVQEAHNRALRLGRDFMEENRDIIAAYQSVTRFEFITRHEIQQTPEYSAHHRALINYFRRSPAFRESVESFGLRYHRNDWDMLSEDEREYRLKSSSNYFIEEFSIFACLVNRGIKVMAYPGSFSTLTEIADNKFPGISKELESQQCEGLYRFDPQAGLVLAANFNSFLDNILANTYDRDTEGLY
jgi:tRNA-dependent cyclodipeptide synthase